jgi:hypothetical protein
MGQCGAEAESDRARVCERREFRSSGDGFERIHNLVSSVQRDVLGYQARFVLLSAQDQGSR